METSSFELEKWDSRLDKDRWMKYIERKPNGIVKFSVAQILFYIVTRRGYGIPRVGMIELEV